MAAPILAEHFTNALLALLDETFDDVHGYYLDRGTALFETLAAVSAETASRPVGGRCATLAAQVKHTAFYLDVLEHSARTGASAPVDWGAIWRTTAAVTPAEWEHLQAGLRASYDRLQALIRETPVWPDTQTIAEALAAVTHTAYHLGEIRQALCTLQSKES
ncbi:MAG: hypothetical protein JNK29_05775 [Anaerolineales bacterium]|nr:hypothetical protein [Anaerolineales bacterium]